MTIEHKLSSTLRFSHLVENYIKYRPGYPLELIPLLNKRIELTLNRILADVGSGTGKLSELFLQNKNIVFGVEPNDEMRAAAEAQFINCLNFRSIKGTAEDTTLSSNSMDIIICGQAFHWFNLKKTQKEFKRILKSQGWVVLIWNERNNEIPFLKQYENFLLENSIDYSEVNHKNIDLKSLNHFFKVNEVSSEHLPYVQHFDFEGLKGRYLSCSYAYKPDHPLFDGAMQNLYKLFEEFEADGSIKMDYVTKIYFCKL